MRHQSFFSALRFLPESFVFLDPDTGGNPPGGNPSEPPKSFTKEDVERIVQGRVANIHQELAAERDKNVKLEARMKALEEKANAPPTPPGEPHDPKDLEGRLRLLENKHKTELDTLTKRLTESEEKRSKEEARRRDVEMTSELTDALQTAGCRADALEMGKRYFIAQVEYDADSEKHVFNLRAGGVVSIREGVAAELPDYLKEPTVKSGGSGSRSGSGSRKAAKEAELELAKAKLNALQSEAKKSGSERDILEYQKQKRLVKELERV